MDSVQLVLERVGDCFVVDVLHGKERCKDTAVFLLCERSHKVYRLVMTELSYLLQIYDAVALDGYSIFCDYFEIVCRRAYIEAMHEHLEALHETLRNLECQQKTKGQKAAKNALREEMRSIQFRAKIVFER